MDAVHVSNLVMPVGLEAEQNKQGQRWGNMDKDEEKQIRMYRESFDLLSNEDKSKITIIEITVNNCI